MANLDQTEARVNALRKATSNDDAFNDTLDLIEQDALVVDNNEIDRLRRILNRYELKIPLRDTLKRNKADARDLGRSLLLTTLLLRINSISRRNEALSALTDKLDELSEGAINDANRLTQIRTAVDTATSTVTTARTLIGALQDPQHGPGVKAILNSLLDTVVQLSSVFSP